MNIQDWLEQHAERTPSNLEGVTSEMWVTKLRGDYLTLVGMEDKLNHLTDLINVSSAWEAGKPVNLGFNPSDGKWYGWSHRAMYGFEIGSEVVRGDCAYCPTDKDDFLKDMIRFWTEDDHVNVTGEHRANGVYIEWEYSHTIPNEKFRGKISGQESQYPDKYGRGEWVAKTNAEARQMAVDFAEGVS